MQKMTEAEWRDFVMTGTRTGKVAILGTDDGPQVTPVWFALDGDDLVFTTASSGRKAAALRRDPRLAICVDDQAPPYAYVMIRGTATLSEDPGELLKWATFLGGRYMGPDRAALYGARNAVPGECLVRVHITKVVAQRDIAA
jgi:PPOX class probable F420-dependent enzyme